MTTEADNNGYVPQSSEPASEGLTIPKHRFDEIASRLREREREIELKNELLNQMRPQQRSSEPELNFEELGLDPQLGKALARIAEHVTDRKVRQAGSILQGQIASTKEVTDETKFLQMFGTDKAKYLDRIKSKRLEHYQLTGTHLPIDSAYKLVVFDETYNQTARTAAKAPANQVPNPAPVVEQDSGVPDSRQTLPNSGSAAAPANKKFTEMSLEEMESGLNGVFANGGIL